MLDLFLAMAAAASYPTVPSSSAMVSLGNSNARSCYLAAENRVANMDTMALCNAALDDVLPAHDRVATLVNRGILKLVMANYPSAEADFNAALAMEPRQGEAWLNKGISLYQRGQDAAALEHFGRAIEYKTRRPAVAYYARGLTNEQSGNLRAAYDDLNRARELAPKWQAPAVELARYQVRRR